MLFYLTRVPRQGQRETENFLTPVIFQNEQETATGSYPLIKTRRAPARAAPKIPAPDICATVRNFSAKIKLEAVAQGGEIACAKRERG